ncbi:MAG: hypothetical protein OXU20_15610 [Myxococcales bacterium]|nr:hypothetical protein [Myxococcales bacterium]
MRTPTNPTRALPVISIRVNPSDGTTEVVLDLNPLSYVPDFTAGHFGVMIADAIRNIARALANSPEVQIAAEEQEIVRHIGRIVQRELDESTGTTHRELVVIGPPSGELE